eukprot:4193001-Amphidinium_carterae.2
MTGCKLWPVLTACERAMMVTRGLHHLRHTPLLGEWICRPASTIDQAITPSSPLSPPEATKTSKA